MRPRFTSFVLGTAVVASAASLADDHRFERHAPRNHGKSFERIATLPNYRNAGSDDIATVSEIVAATENGRLLIYTDASAGTIGLVSIHFPAFPIPLGTVDVGGDPTSVDILGNEYALVGVNTSASFTNPPPRGHQYWNSSDRCDARSRRAARLGEDQSRRSVRSDRDRERARRGGPRSPVKAKSSSSPTTTASRTGPKRHHFCRSATSIDCSGPSDVTDSLPQTADQAAGGSSPPARLHKPP